jgi:mRNA (2'-O-methyladenosine-N6-)-methyltransferase
VLPLGMEIPDVTVQEEMQNMPMGSLQNDGGLLFLWVTVRTQDLGRQCLQRWGYARAFCVYHTSLTDP